MRYKILVDQDPTRLAEKVNSWLNDGWLPLGGVSITTRQEYMQAVELSEAIQEMMAPENLGRDLASALAHRGCCGSEHDPQNGKLHGFCLVCGVPWPCDTAQYFLRKPK